MRTTMLAINFTLALLAWSASAATMTTSKTIAEASRDETETTKTATTMTNVDVDVERYSKRNGSGSGDDESPSGKLSISNENGQGNSNSSLETELDQGQGEVSSVERKSINMSEVDRMYVEGRKDEQEVVEFFQLMTKKLKKTIGNALGAIVPIALNKTGETKISSDCLGSMLKWTLGMSHLKSWALKMLDAAGKPTAGLFEGSMTMFGNHRQCIKIRAPDDDEIEFSGGFQEHFRGKYCIIQMKPWLPKKSRFYNMNAKIKGLVGDTEEGEEANKLYDRTIFEEFSDWTLAFNFVDIRLDICVPSLCRREDLQSIIQLLVESVDIKARVLRCEMESKTDGGITIESGQAEMKLVSSNSNSDADGGPSSNNSKSVSWNFIQRTGWALIPVLAITTVLLATVCSIFKDRGHAIKSLSLKRSVSNHLNVDYDQLADDKPLALYGFRFIITIWIMIAEFAFTLKFEFLRELMVLKDLMFWWPFQFIINSTLQFDSIILLTAFTMGYKNYGETRAIKKSIVDKYIRLVPSIMLLVALTILLPFLYRGPVWNDFVAKQAAVCLSNGWFNSLLLQNNLPYKEICLPNTWLIAVEFQLVCLMSPIVYYLNKKLINGTSSKLGACKPLFWVKTAPGALLVGCIVLSMAGSFYNVYSNNLPPTWLYTMADPDSRAIYYNEHLMRLLTHLGVFSLGLLAGLECKRTTKDSKQRGSNSSSSLSTTKSIILETIGSIAVITTMSAIIFSTYDWSVNDLPGPIVAGLYDIASRFLWSLAMIWILFKVSIPAKATVSATTNQEATFRGIGLGSRGAGGCEEEEEREYKEFSLFARALGHPGMVCLGKLSFLIYIIHPFVHTTVLAIQEQPIYSSWLMLFHVLLGNFTLTVILASLVSVFVEMPFRNLLFRRCGSSMFLTQTVVDDANSRANNVAAATDTSAASTATNHQ